MDSLAEAFQRFERLPIPLERRRASAVAMVVSGDEEPGIWLTRRAPKLRSHPGQFALPGGRFDNGEDAVDAAVRELREELGITVGRERCVGSLDDYATRSGYVITPVVLRCDDGQRPEPNHAEVAEVYRVPLRDLDVEPRYLRIPGGRDGRILGLLHAE